MYRMGRIFTPISRFREGRDFDLTFVGTLGIYLPLPTRRGGRDLCKGGWGV